MYTFADSLRQLQTDRYRDTSLISFQEMLQQPRWQQRENIETEMGCISILLYRDSRSAKATDFTKIRGRKTARERSGVNAQFISAFVLSDEQSRKTRTPGIFTPQFDVSNFVFAETVRYRCLKVLFTPRTLTIRRWI